MTIEDLFKSLEGINELKIREWIIARRHILDRCPHLDGIKGISPDSNKHVHVNIIMDNENNEENMRQTAAIVRQVALISHYPNFREDNEDTRTIISIIHNNDNSSQLKKLLKTYMGNLTDYCQFTVDGKIENQQYKLFKNFMPLDVAIEIRNCNSLCPIEGEREIKTVIRMSDVTKDYPSTNPEDETSIKRSMLINMVYNTGADIDNLPAYDNANVQRYSTALDYFFNHSSEGDIQLKWESAKFMDKLSCLFCADCISERLDGLLDTTNKTMIQYIENNKNHVRNTIKKHIEAMALCEHSRWNVEKLILGFRPYTIQERFTIESLFGEARKNYRNYLKDKLVHFDLCSYRNLRRIDPGNIKYDYFLMLAIPHILLSNHFK